MIVPVKFLPTKATGFVVLTNVLYIVDHEDRQQIFFSDGSNRMVEGKPLRVSPISSPNGGYMKPSGL